MILQEKIHLQVRIFEKLKKKMSEIIDRDVKTKRSLGKRKGDITF